MTRRVQGDDHYNRRFDNTGYQRPPEGPPVYTSETPAPTDADIPKTLVPRQDATGEPFLLEVHTAPIPKEATVPTGSPRKKKRGFTLRLGEQTETVVRVIREEVKVGERFNLNLVYGWFSKEDKDRWRRAYGDQTHVKEKLLKAITNVAFSGNHLGVVHVVDTSRTWVLKSKSGSSTKGPRKVAPKKTPEISMPKVVRPDPDLFVQWKKIGEDYNGDTLYITKAGVVGRLTFTPVDPQEI